MGDGGGDAIEKSLTQLADVCVISFHFHFRHLSSLAQAHCKCRRKCATSQPALLTSSTHLWYEPYTGFAADIQRSHTFWAVYLVARNRQEVDVHRIHVDRNLANALSCIAVEKHLPLSAHFANLLYRLDHTYLVVYCHHRYEAGVIAHSRAQHVQIDQAVTLYRQVCNIKAFFFQVTARIEHTLVLCLCCDDVPLPLFVELHDALDGDVVRLGRAGGEHHLLRVCTDQVGDLTARILHCVLRIPPVLVSTRVGIAVLLTHEGQHGVQHSRVNRSCSLHIQVGGSAGKFDSSCCGEQGGRRVEGSHSHSCPKWQGGHTL
mmetsp:Transcript_39914/g.102906  ORF Transcript_39914/g.102906 Transcript_39914/m.102906 type:complete len:318 (-) Transcript_39914:73-1026(-)